MIQSTLIYGVPLTKEAYNYLENILEDDYYKYFESFYSGCHDIPSAYIGIEVASIDMFSTFVSINELLSSIDNINNDINLSNIKNKINNLPPGLSELLPNIDFYIMNHTS